ncbi:DNA polymerase delta small subunit Cdc1, partial [Kickxella alabastrina]
MESPRPHFARAHVDSTDKFSSAFLTGRRTYAQQFDQLYYKRLQHLKPHILAHAHQKWGSQAQLTASVLNVDSSLGTTYIIGTVFIDSPRKPSTLQQVESEHRVSDPVVTQGYRGTDEAVFLEDESGRIRLMGEQISKTLLISGVVAAVLGVETAAGDFEVADVCFAGMPPQLGPLRIMEDPGADSDADPLLMLVSGLGATLARPITLQMQLLGELLGGTLGATRTQKLAARIAHVVVAGNTMDLPTAPLGHAEDARTNDRSGAARLAAQVDDFLADIAGCVPLTVMPGARDPADASLPQQPMPRGMFAQCARTSAFRSL